MLRDLMWDIFFSTGDIAAYLVYRQCEANPEGLGTERE